MIPSYRTEHTGQPMLDRIQAALAEAIDAIRRLDARLPALHSLALRSDFTTTSADAQNTALEFPVHDGELWLIEGCFPITVDGSANGMKYAIGAPPQSEITALLDSSLTSSTDDTHVQITAVNTLTGAVHTVNGGTRVDHLNGRIKVVGDGMCTLQVASTTAGNTTTVRARAWLRATRYREV